MAPVTPVTLAVVGAGNRGTAHGDWALANPGRARVVAVSEPREPRRARFAARHRLGAEAVVADWRDLAGRSRVADAALVCTQDAMHVEPAIALAEAGYHVLLEKPMATTEAGCRRIVEAVERAGVILSVGHVLRYTPYTALVKRVVDAGRLGEVVSAQHLEPVGFLHQAHSYVRGPWRREDIASFMLLAKSCHDLDWLQYVVGRPIRRVSSFGGLAHFTPEHRPAGAADRCLDCGVEPDCPYSAVRFYTRCLTERGAGWPLDAVVDDYTEADLLAALRHGPYGRCVYGTDNDVVDHQVVAMEFDGGATGTFTMTGFNAGGHRRTRLFGTHGELDGDGETVRVFDFLTRQTEVLEASPPGDPTAGGGHGGGDWGLMDAFVQAVATGDRSPIRSGPRESLAAHLAVFAAERARHEGVVATVPE
jgi:predicted dehydrogenase